MTAGQKKMYVQMEACWRRHASLMAIEVARAYDEDKNLVPLYILTDSDPIYDPVTPGFAYSANVDPAGDYASHLSIINDSKNPTGGNMIESGSTNVLFPMAFRYTIGNQVKLTIDNMSLFNITIYLNLSASNNPSDVIWDGTTSINSESTSVVEFNATRDARGSGLYAFAFLISVV